jgi:hypothetical protein
MYERSVGGAPTARGNKETVYKNFFEPMASYDFLLERKTFVLTVPRPARLGRTTGYPTECLALYDKQLDAYHFVFVGFRRVE